MTSVGSEQYDIIFIGGGVAGCVAAGRLAVANPSLKILIIEAGPHSFDVPIHVQPARYVPNLLNPNKTSKSFTLHVSKPSPATLNRLIVVPAARVPGGGSSVNFMVYTRAAASDYDAWETQFDNPDWGSKSLIPLLKKAETYQPLLEASGEESNKMALSHGDSGPLKISFQKDHINVINQFLQVVGEYDKDRGLADDINDFNTCNKYAKWQRFIDETTGRRSDTAHHFIYNLTSNGNLTILTEKRAVRVLFEGTKAVGVEYVDHNSASDGVLKSERALASKLVVVSAGPFGSPAILERSGIGGKDILLKNGIDPLVDLPGVGENYMDHNVIMTHYAVSQDAETLDSVFRGSDAELEVLGQEWRETGKGLLAQNGLGAGIKLRPVTREEFDDLGPTFENRWKTFFADYPDKPVMLAAPLNAYYGPDPAPPGKCINMCYYSGYPVSVGHVHIAQGLDPYGPLDFDAAYFTSPADVSIFRWTYKHLREIARRMPFYRGEIEGWHPNFSEDSEAKLNIATGPVPIDAPKIHYTKDDDEKIDEFHRKMVGTAWHGAGTCAMKPRERQGVVDSKLNVYGTTNLKVADMSICPENVGANTYNTAVAIGEKSAVIIAEELGFSL